MSNAPLLIEADCDRTPLAPHHVAPIRRITWWQLTALVYVMVAGTVGMHWLATTSNGCFTLV